MSPKKTQSAKTMSPKVSIVDGTRTPFIKSNGAFSSLMAHDLARFAINGLVQKTNLSANAVDFCLMGCVISDPQTSNVAREAVLGSQLNRSTPAFTTTMACISANAAITTGANQISLGQSDVVIAGGTETFSDPPIRVSKRLRQAMSQSQKAKGFGDYMRLLSKLRPKDLVPEIPSAAEFSTGNSMGEGCERMVRQFSVSRQESDEFAMRSHQLAAKAWADGKYDADVVRVNAPPSFAVVEQDNGPRGDTDMARLSKLKPAFDKKFGLNTAGNSSFFTDGASAVLLMSDDGLKKTEKKALATLEDAVYAGGDPLDELLLGPGLTIPLLLERANLSVKDIDVWELHEAFASQICANLKFMASDTWARERLLKDKAIGEIPMDKINRWGGSLSLGHPFGATGGRLVLTAARRLQDEDGEWAVVSGCAAGGLGSAILLRRAS